MLKRLFARGFLVVLLSLAGCNNAKLYQMNVQQHATVGSPIMAWEQGFAMQKTRKELVYNGVDGQTLNIAYREYSGDGHTHGRLLARPAFSQDLKYNIDGPSIVTFRDVTIQVLAADSSGISFVVVAEPAEMRGN
jgi:hypothetical protein